MKVAGNLACEDLAERLEPIQKRAVAAIELVERPGRHPDAVAQRVPDLRHGDLRLGAELDLLGHVRFFRRAGSFAHSSGRYTLLSSNT